MMDLQGETVKREIDRDRERLRETERERQRERLCSPDKVINICVPDIVAEHQHRLLYVERRGEGVNEMPGWKVRLRLLLGEY